MKESLHIDTLAAVRQQSELVARGAYADVYRKGIIPEGYVLKLHHDAARAEHEAKCLEAFAKSGIGGGFYGLWAGKGILQRDIGVPNPFVNATGQGLVFAGYLPWVNEIPMDVMDQWETAFAELHARGVAHNNISPQNILFDAQHCPRLVGMGRAVIADGNGQPDKNQLAAVKAFLLSLKERRFEEGQLL